METPELDDAYIIDEPDDMFIPVQSPIEVNTSIISNLLCKSDDITNVSSWFDDLLELTDDFTVEQRERWLNQAVFSAVLFGRLDCLKYMIETSASHVSPNFLKHQSVVFPNDYKFGSLLYIACREGYLPIVKYLCVKGCECHSNDPLKISFLYNHTDIVEYLLNRFPERFQEFITFLKTGLEITHFILNGELYATILTTNPRLLYMS